MDVKEETAKTHTTQFGLTARNNEKNKKNNNNGKTMKKKRYKKPTSDSEARANIRKQCRKSPATVEGGKRRRFLG